MTEETNVADEAKDGSTERRGYSKRRQGVVVSAKMDKTVIVRVERRVKHPKYKKFIRVRKRYAAHDTIGVAEGDIVLIQESRPLSKTKRWRVLQKL